VSEERGWTVDEREAEFAEFFTAAWPRLFRPTYALTGDAAAAEDALQSAFAKAFAKWPRIRSLEHPEAYVRRMALNEVLGVRRRSFWRSETTTADPPATETSDAADIGVADRDAVWRALLGLPVRQRAVIVLRYYEDLSEREIASVLAMAPGTVKSLASAAMTKLRERLGDSTTTLGGHR
jgi:RNA polymerase sigma-70 factor (sigma-E family)